MDDISSKAKEGLRKGLDFIKSRAKETVDIQKLGTRIKQMEQRREECILDLGHRVFVMFEMDRFEPDSLKDRVDEIRDLNGQIETLQAEMAETRDHFKQSVEQLVRTKEEVATPADAEAEPAPEPAGTRLIQEETAAGTRVLKEDSEPE